MGKKGKVIYTALAGTVLLALYCIIFCFSAQDGEISGGISLKISQMGVEWWNDLTNRGWSEQLLMEWAEYFEHPIRKLAHFAEYAFMGFLQYSILRCNFGKRKLLIGITILWVVISAAADEIHQLFVPGRWGSLTDVILDTCGGIFGVFVCIILMKIIVNIRKNRAKRA